MSSIKFSNFICLGPMCTGIISRECLGGQPYLQVLGPLNEVLEVFVIEDDLLRHNTNSVDGFMKESYTLHKVKFFTAQMIHMFKVVDQNIGVRFNETAYLAHIMELIKHLSEFIEMLTIDDGIVKLLSLKQEGVRECN